MPDRTLREALWTSPKFAAVGPTAQLLFIRLISKADDFGCFDGRPEVIATQCYPIGGPTSDREDQEEFREALAELHRVGLIIRYRNAGRVYVAIPQWKHDYRYKRRFPAPPINVDVREQRLRGKYGKEIDWSNPDGCDPVSFLLDHTGALVEPQPPEWRRVRSDFSPLGLVTKKHPVTEDAVTASPTVTGRQSLEQSLPQSLQSAPQSLSTSASPLLRDLETLRPRDSETLATQATIAVTDKTPVTAQRLQTTTTPNGGIKLNSEGWSGISEQQVLAWQEMFDGLSIPDQLARSAQWLLANPRERTAYEQQDDGLRAFIVRWLLRESRPAQH